MGAVVTSGGGTVTIYGSGGTAVVAGTSKDVEVAAGQNTVTARDAPGTVEITAGRPAEGIPYTGEYVSTPTWGRQVYGTNGRLMTDDFTVEGIVKLEVGNSAGGLTLTI